MRPQPLLVPAALAFVTAAFLPLVAGAQIEPTETRFGGLCIAPRSGPWYAPFTGIAVEFGVPPESLLAALPAMWQGRERIGIALDMREPGMTLKFQPSIFLGDGGGYGTVQFEPPPPWRNPVDSLNVSWPPLQPGEFFGRTTFNNECVFHLSVGGPVVVTADATVNIIGFYASDVDTVKVWGTDLGWPDIQLHDQRLSILAPVEEGTWGRIKAYLMNGGR